jgi:hypothetical protein
VQGAFRCGWASWGRTHIWRLGCWLWEREPTGQSAALDQQRKTCRILELSIPEFQSKCKRLSCLLVCIQGL